MEKDNKNPIVKKYFDVRIETWLPATLLFRVLAENPEDVIQIIKGLKPNSIQYNLIGRKDIKLTVYDAGCSMIRLIRNLLGR